jgi:hypothetical protein
MTRPESERPAAGEAGTAAAPEEGGADAERRALSYSGSRVPIYVVLIWFAFFVWGLIYLVRWVPESWREWFAR